MEGLPEELEFELEALKATYGDDAVHVEPASSVAGGGGSGSGGASPPVAVVSLPVGPRCEAEHEQFVAGRLVMTAGGGYPAEPPAVQLADAKGLGDARLAGIQSSLATEAAALAGELQLGHLCETAIDLLTDANTPEGACAFCLEPLLLGAGGAAGGGGSCVRLECFHCFHTACFAPWWQWQQRRSAQREAQLWSEYKSMAPLKLEEEGIRREPLSWLAAGAGGGGSSAGPDSAANGAGAVAAEEEHEGDGKEGSSQGPGEAYVLLCPACRADIVPSHLAHAWRQLQAATADSWSSSGSQGRTGGRAALDCLPPQQQQALLAMQQRHAAVMRRQQSCGGIVDATHSVSLFDLQQAAAAAAAAETPAAEAAALAATQQAQQAQQRQAGGPGRGGRQGRGGAHRSAGHGPPPGFPGRQLRDGPGDGGGTQVASGRGRGRGRGRSGHHGPAAACAPLAAAEGALAGMQLSGAPHQPQQQHPPQQQQQQQHGQGGGSRPGRSGGGCRGGRGGRHGRGSSGRGREGGRGRESTAGRAGAAAAAPVS